MVGLPGHSPIATARRHLKWNAELDFWTMLPRYWVLGRQPRLGFPGTLPHFELLRVSHLPMLAPLKAVLDLDV